MNTDRIKEIQEETAYPESVSVQQALLKVWNETAQEFNLTHEDRLKRSFWNIFKSKQEKEKIKEKSLQEQLEDFTKKYSNYFNSYAFDGKHIVIYREPEIKDGKIILNYINKNTAKGYQNYAELWLFQLQYGEEFMKQHRNAFINLKDEFEKLGLKLEKVEI